MYELNVRQTLTSYLHLCRSRRTQSNPFLLQPVGSSCARTACETYADFVRFQSVPGPLANLKFTKLDLGHVPISFSNVDVHKTPNDGIKLDMDMDWQGVCDIELDGARVPKIVSAFRGKFHGPWLKLMNRASRRHG